MNKIQSLLTYTPDAPMLFSSGLFLFLFTAFLAIYISLNKQTSLRIIYVSLFSLYFYYKSSGISFLLLILVATSDFTIGNRLTHTCHETKRKLLVLLSLTINLSLLCYFKYFNFILDITRQLGNQAAQLLSIPTLQTNTPTPHFDIFLPVGISFFTFQSLSYIIDLYRNKITPVNRWIDYLFYVSFFPQLVAGPIIRARDFIPQIYKRPTLTKQEFGEALFLITCGLLKKTIISDYISLNFVDRIFDAPLLYTGLENLLAIYGYALQIYCDFSGYSDMAIGIALLLGFRFNINFNSPYQAATITEFWRRWHISLSSWLKDYLYISLGGNRKGKARTYLNLIITMLLGGLWHGASIRFIIWGAIHGLSLAIHKLIINHFPNLKPTGTQMPPIRRIPGIIITFHIVCFGWIFFRATSMQTITDMLTQITHNFHPEILPQFITGYPLVTTLIIAGYTFHYLPQKLDISLRTLITNAPLPLQALILITLIFLITQLKSAGVQPFIYFQF